MIALYAIAMHMFLELVGADPARHLETCVSAQSAGGEQGPAAAHTAGVESNPRLCAYRLPHRCCPAAVRRLALSAHAAHQHAV